MQFCAVSVSVFLTFWVTVSSDRDNTTAFCIAVQQKRTIFSPITITTYIQQKPDRKSILQQWRGNITPCTYQVVSLLQIMLERDRCTVAKNY